MAYPISAYFGRRTYAHLDACVYCRKPYDDSGGWHTLQQTIEKIDIWCIVCDGCYHEAAPEPGCAAHGVRVAREEGGEVMNGHCCPACGSSGIVMTDDFEHDLTILKCRVCGEMFAISNMDAYNNGESWVFSEWANSIETQKRLCGKAVKQ